MASTTCFVHYHAALSGPAAARTSSQRYALPLKPGQLVCRAQKQMAAQEDDGRSAVLSRRLALTALIGATAIGSKVLPADAAFGESVGRESIAAAATAAAAAPVVKVVALCGSLRKASNNRGLIRAAIEISKSIPGLEIEYVEISPLPFLNTDLEKNGTYPSEVEAFRSKVRAADSILFASPEYNYSVTGPLKNAIDWASRPPNVMDRKAAAIVSTGIDFGGGRMQYHLRQIGVRLDINFINRPEFFLNAFDPPPKFDQNGDLIDDSVKERLRDILLSLRDFTLRLRS